jgi:uncharacterized protein
MNQESQSDLRRALEWALKDAMRSGNDVRKRTLRMVLSAIRLAEIEAKGENTQKRTSLDDAGIIAILQKELKSRQEAISDAQKAQRPDIIQDAEAEIEVIQEFLPQPFTPQELDDVAEKVIAETGAASIKDMGKVMKVLVPRLEGRATGDQASQAVRRLLQQDMEPKA